MKLDLKDEEKKHAFFTVENLCRLKFVLRSIRRHLASKQIATGNVDELANTKLTPDHIPPLVAQMLERLDGKVSIQSFHYIQTDVMKVLEIINNFAKPKEDQEYRDSVAELIPLKHLIELIAFIKITSVDVDKRRRKRKEIMAAENTTRRLRLTKPGYFFESYENEPSDTGANQDTSTLNLPKVLFAHNVPVPNVEYTKKLIEILDRLSEATIRGLRDELFGDFVKCMDAYITQKFNVPSKEIRHAMSAARGLHVNGKRLVVNFPLQLHRSFNQNQSLQRSIQTLDPNKQTSTHNSNTEQTSRLFRALSIEPGETIKDVIVVDVVSDGACFFHAFFLSLHSSCIFRWTITNDLTKLAVKSAYVITKVCTEMAKLNISFWMNMGVTDFYTLINHKIKRTLTEIGNVEDKFYETYITSDKTLAFMNFHRFIRLFTLYETYWTDGANKTRPQLNLENPDPRGFYRSIMRLFPWVEIDVADNTVTGHEVERLNADVLGREFEGENTLSPVGTTHRHHVLLCRRMQRNVSHFLAVLCAQPELLIRHRDGK